MLVVPYCGDKNFEIFTDYNNYSINCFTRNKKQSACTSCGILTLNKRLCGQSVSQDAFTAGVTGHQLISTNSTAVRYGVFESCTFFAVPPHTYNIRCNISGYSGFALNVARYVCMSVFQACAQTLQETANTQQCSGTHSYRDIDPNQCQRHQLRNLSRTQHRLVR